MVQLHSDDIPRAYASLMTQVKERIAQANHWLRIGGKPPHDWNSIFLIEGCYLQVRKIIETLALAVVIAHNESETFRTKTLVKKWNAQSLFNELQKLNNTAFPVAISIESETTTKLANVVVHTKNYYSKSDISRIYNVCGARLHTGTLRSMTRKPVPYKLNEIEKWLNELQRLLNTHMIRLPNLEATLITCMATPPGGSVQCSMTRVVSETSLHNAKAQFSDLTK